MNELTPIVRTDEISKPLKAKKKARRVMIILIISQSFNCFLEVYRGLVYTIKENWPEGINL